MEFQGLTPPVLAWCCRGVGAPGAVTRPGPGLLSQWVGRISLLLPALVQGPSHFSAKRRFLATRTLILVSNSSAASELSRCCRRRQGRCWGCCCARRGDGPENHPARGRVAGTQTHTCTGRSAGALVFVTGIQGGDRLSGVCTNFGPLWVKTVLNYGTPSWWQRLRLGWCEKKEKRIETVHPGMELLGCVVIQGPDEEHPNCGEFL